MCLCASNGTHADERPEVVDMDLADIVSQIKGPEGSGIRLEFRRNSSVYGKVEGLGFRV